MTNGCPFPHDRADAFDMFDAPYQADPAQALAWARAQAPVFYAPRMGYWVVSRYEDIKSVFRDPVLFSPANVLERLTPPCDAAMEVLKTYGFQLNRTLVNEDEPAHMARRRVLLDHFLPENLVPKAERIRALTVAAMDKFIDRGRVDLVAAMLYEVPLSVALDFLGVPPDDAEKLRAFSVAHSVNTWGRPTPAQQIEVAHAVGQFWRYAGEVIERMRAEPDGTGWMHQTIRLNAQMPDVVTDSYVHSMMMAIIVAAHETTSLASVNMVKVLMENRAAWDDICADPALIPNAVEECLRYAGSIVAWRRVTTAPTRLAGVDLPAGAKLFIVQASGNRDEARFAQGDAFDIYRPNTADHLTFGYGAHQCLGKNIGRMEMRIFLQELTRRLPHLRLSQQDFSYLPNTSFRGPEALWVEWDPALNPERAGPLRPAAPFPIGAPDRRAVSRPVVVQALRAEADGVLGVTLACARGRDLPGWQAGAHVDLIVGGHERSYSLVGQGGAYDLAILREEGGRGGSVHLHNVLRPGMALRMRGPSNNFAPDLSRPAVLIAGGIGITPILAMADAFKAAGQGYVLQYCGSRRGRMAFVDRIARDHPGAELHVADEGGRADLAALIAGRGAALVYACGPARMLAALGDLCPPEALRVEHFGAAPGAGATGDAFDVTLADSGLDLHVPGEQSLLEVLNAAGIDLPSDCREGLCGSCEVAVVSGDLAHRCAVLTGPERAEGARLMACCSRARGRLVLRL